MSRNGHFKHVRGKINLSDGQKQMVAYALLDIT